MNAPQTASVLLDTVDLNPPLSLLAEVCRDAKTFYQKDWLLATSGNLSVRHPQTLPHHNFAFWITESGLDKGDLSPAHFLLSAPNTEALLPSEIRRPSAETALHALIYKTFPQVNVVYHCHSLTASFLSQHLPKRWNRLPLPPIEMLKAVGANSHEEALELPVFENSQNIAQLAGMITDELAQFDVPGLLLRGHGLYAWGHTRADAKRHIEGFHFLLDYLKLSNTPE
jgi:methylthioribulose-1-phosphate dehydratase